MPFNFELSTLLIFLIIAIIIGVWSIRTLPVVQQRALHDQEKGKSPLWRSASTSVLAECLFNTIDQYRVTSHPIPHEAWRATHLGR